MRGQVGSVLLAGWCVLSSAPVARAAPPPAAAYAAFAPATTARLSPDGKSIVFLNGTGNVLMPMVANLDTAKTTPIPVTNATPDWVMWKDNQTILTSLRVTTMLDGVIPMGNTRLFALAADGSKGAQIDLDRPGSHETYFLLNLQDQVLNTLPARQDHLLAQVKYDDDVYPSVFDVNPWTSIKDMKQDSFGHVENWAADQNGDVRAGITWLNLDEQGAYETHVIARSSDSDSWHRVNYEISDVAFSATDPSVLYALIDPRNAPARVTEIDIATGTIKATLATAPEGTIELLTHNGVMIGYGIYATTGATYTYTDPDWAADATAIATATGDPSVALIDRSDDGKRALALVRHLGQPDVAWLLDRTQNPANLAPVLTDYPDVPADQITVGKWTSITARDGLTIPLLVTMPPGVTNGPIPFVVLPHGGPDSRDYGPFSWLVQFLTTRGYGVLQPQFRGSNGFGTDFRDKGNNQWGLAMQDDITDATKWLISQNLADPKKICIVGASFGGYAALEGAEKEPGLYACAAALAPVTDLPRLLNTNRSFAFFPPKTGQDTDQLEATSPDQHADRIQIPILMIAGRQDFTVNPEQTEKMEAALKAAGKTEQTIYLPNADHYFTFTNDRLAVLNALEGFLGTNLK